MKGALAKAPGFDTVPGFDPTSNELWKLRVHIDQLGFIWVNMDTYVTLLVQSEASNRELRLALMQVRGRDVVREPVRRVLQGAAGAGDGLVEL